MHAAYKNLHFSIHNYYKVECCVYINYLRCRLVEGVKIFLVCVIDHAIECK